MEKKFTCHKCGKKYNSDFWFDWHLTNHKKKFNKYNIILGLIAIISMLVGAYNLYLYLEDRIPSEPNLTFDWIEVVEENGIYEMRMGIKNIGESTAKMYFDELEIIGQKPTTKDISSIIGPGETRERHMFKVANWGLNKKIEFRYKIRYFDLSKEDNKYCSEHFFRYEGTIEHPITWINSTICD